MKAFTAPLLELAEFDTIQKTKYREPGMIQIAGSTGSQKGHLAYALAREDRRVLYVVQDEEKAKEILEEYQFLDAGVFFYPAKDFLFYRADIRGKYLTQKRMEVIRALREEEKVTVVTTIDALMDGVRPPSGINGQIFTLRVGDMSDLEELKVRLSKMDTTEKSRLKDQGSLLYEVGFWTCTP